MKADRRINLCALTSRPHGPLLLARFPLSAEQRLTVGASGDELLKELLAILGQKM